MFGVHLSFLQNNPTKQATSQSLQKKERPPIPPAPKKKSNSVLGLGQVLSCHSPGGQVIVAAERAHRKVVEVLIGVQGRQAEVEAETSGNHSGPHERGPEFDCINHFKQVSLVQDMEVQQNTFLFLMYASGGPHGTQNRALVQLVTNPSGLDAGQRVSQHDPE